MKKATRLDKVRWLMVYTTDVIFLTVGFGFVVLVAMAEEQIMPLPLLYAQGVLLVVLYALSTRPFRIAVRGGPRPTKLLIASGVITLLLLVSFVFFAVPVWLAMLAPFVRRRTIVILSAALVVLLSALSAIGGVAALGVVSISLTFLTTVMVGGVLANLWLWRIAAEAHEGQEATALLAVAEERLRFARDLNDLVGRGLADITTRSGEAEDLLATDPALAAREMFEVRDLARSSLRQVRTAVQGYRALDLDEVLASVRAVLEAADVRCAVDADTVALPPETRTLLASMVRQGATNILMHSKAQHCTITIRNGVLEMSNDGAGSQVDDGLATRVTAAGGSLTADGGRFLLRVAVPS